MVMHLLPAYYTTTSTRKRRSRKKSKSLIEAERKHAKFLKRVMGIGDKCYGSTAGSNPAREGSIPSSPAKDLPPLSNVIPVGVAAQRKTLKHNFTIAPAYNKGAYQVISKRDIKDIGR